MIEIDGSLGEGGGQILRTSLSLSMATGQAFRIKNIRANRERPGLMRQHLTAVHAAEKISNASVDSGSIGSRELTFKPGPVRPGQYTFSLGTAGSTTLVAQTLLVPLQRADGRSDLVLEGGTHNPFAPPFEFMKKAFIDSLKRVGAKVEMSLNRPGYYPAGGGSISIGIEPSGKLSELSLVERGPTKRRQARALVSNIPFDVAAREAAVVKKRLGWADDEVQAREVKGAQGPGNVVLIEIESENVTEVFVGFGEKRVRAETVASRVADQARRYLASEVAVGRYLADQLLIPLVLGSGGQFTTQPLTQHTLTNIEVIKKFLPAGISVEEVGEQQRLIEVRPGVV